MNSNRLYGDGAGPNPDETWGQGPNNPYGQGPGPSYSPGEWGYGLDVVTECDPPSGIVFVASGSYATTCVFAENIAAELVGYSPASDASVPFTAYDDLLSRDSSGTCDRIEDGDGAYVYECTTDFGDVAYVRP